MKIENKNKPIYYIESILSLSNNNIQILNEPKLNFKSLNTFNNLPFDGLINSLNFASVSCLPGLKVLIYNIELVLKQKIKSHIFPYEGIGYSVLVTKDITKESDDIEGIDTSEFLLILKYYLNELEKYYVDKKEELKSIENNYSNLKDEMNFDRFIEMTTKN